MKRRLASILLACLVLSCGYVDYENAPEGEFSGGLFVMWIGEGGTLGDGAFVYVPNPGDPLTFTRRRPDGSVQKITPEMMYTDGGSIPKIAQVFKGFSPWGYAPAYMVHDWLFVARHCNKDGTPNDAERQVADMSFQDSAVIIAEAIKTLSETGRVQRNDVAGLAISGAVAGPISRSLWDEDGACPDPRVSEADRLAASAAFPGRARIAVEGALRTLPSGGVVPVRPAAIVSQISF